MIFTAIGSSSSIFWAFMDMAAPSNYKPVLELSCLAAIFDSFCLSFSFSSYFSPPAPDSSSIGSILFLTRLIMLSMKKKTNARKARKMVPLWQFCAIVLAIQIQFNYCNSNPLIVYIICTIFHSPLISKPFPEVTPLSVIIYISYIHRRTSLNMSKIQRSKSTSVNKKHHKSVGFVQKEEQPPKNNKTNKVISIHEKEVIRSPSRLFENSQYKTDDYNETLERKMKELEAKCEKMYAIIDLFNLMQSNGMAVRCMQHNNTLSLYCLTERKILCVNCTYGATKHRTHKIMPLRDSNKFINEDNEELKVILDNDLKLLEESNKNTKENVMVLEREMRQTLEKLEADYMKKCNYLKIKYEESKIKAKQSYEKLIKKSREIEANVEQFKFKIWETLSKVGIGKRGDTIANDNAVIRQVFSSSLCELTKYQVAKISRRELQRLQQRLKF